MKYIVIDTESCTGRSDDGSLCSIGYAVCDENFNILEQDDILINPLPKRFSVGDKKNAKRTGITFAYSVDEFRKSPKFCDIYSKIVELFKDKTVLGFSMTNDIKYLNNACDCFSLHRIEYKFYDIQFIYQLLFPEQTSIGLKTLSANFGIEYLEHRSDEDAISSLLLLKKFLGLYGANFSEVIDKFEINAGINTSKGYHVCYANALIEEKFGLKRSKRIQSLILNNHIKNLPRKRTVQTVCFSYKIEKLDVNFIRTLIDLSLEKNIAYSHDTDVCTIYVTNDEEDVRLNYLTPKQQDKIRILTLNEFCSLVGYVEDKAYDDKDFLKDYYETLL